MSAVPKPQYSDLRSARFPLHAVPDLPTDLFQGRKQPQPVQEANPIAPRRMRRQSAVIESFPTPRSQPKWLQALFTLQQATTIAAWGLGVGVLGLYSWTVYSQQVWAQKYERLSQLQRSEEQMLSAIEGLKEQATVQAADANLQPATPSTTIPLVSAGHEANNSASSAQAADTTNPAKADKMADAAAATPESANPFAAKFSHPQSAEVRAQLPTSLGY